MTYDRTPITGEILTPTAAPGETEPRLTLSQLQGLLREAAALERAQRPIVVHTATAPAPHPGADVHIPAAPLATTAASRERNPWPLVFMVSACTGIGSCLVTSVTGSLVPMAVTLAAFAVWGVATYQLVFVREP
jgi:hypothetical protein